MTEPPSLRPFPTREECVVPDLLATRAAETPDKPFILFEEEQWTYGEAATQAWRTGNALQKAGVELGDYISVWVPTGPDVVRAWFGANAAGAVYAPLNLAAKGTYLEHTLRVAEARVLVAGVFRPPALSGPTLGERPRDLSAASSETPFPLTLVMPPFPPLASAAGVVLLEANVDGRGDVTTTTVVRSAPPFDGAAQDALRQWKFRPARAGNVPRAALVYVVFGFPLPVGIGNSPGD
jgi:TonB family protein